MNSLPLRNSYEVLRIEENDYVENKNDNATKRTIISERNIKKIHKGRNSRFFNKVSDEWFFHSNEINQNPAVVPGNRSYASTTKCGKKVIVLRDLCVWSHLGRINKKLFSNSIPKCRTRLKYFSVARTKYLEYSN